MEEHNLTTIKNEKMNVPLLVWDKAANGKKVPMESEVFDQLSKTCSLPFVFHHAALMSDGHVGIGCAVGSVIPTKGAIIPAAVGVDLGCGMMAAKTDLKANDLPDNLFEMRSEIEKAVPHGRTANGGKGDRGAWGNTPPSINEAWSNNLDLGWKKIVEKYPKLERGSTISQLGTLGGGNHFWEVCLDESNSVWVMLHSGSRGVGNRIGTFFIAKARENMEEKLGSLPDQDLAWLSEGSEDFNDYVSAVLWAQNYAKISREEMLRQGLKAIQKSLGKAFKAEERVISCHHNYISPEIHYGEKVWVTRKGAVSARLGEMGIIPGSMGGKSYIVSGKGNEQSFTSCSHGAGRVMSRTRAKEEISLEDHIKATEGVECRKDKNVIDESPAAYKNIDLVIEAQRDLIEVVHTLKAILCVKG